MDREDTKRAIEVMQAYADGEEIEFAAILVDGSRDKWKLLDACEPIWDWETTDYRVKKMPRMFTIIEDRSGRIRVISGTGAALHPSETSIIVREVLDD